MLPLECCCDPFSTISTMVMVSSVISDPVLVLLFARLRVSSDISHTQTHKERSPLPKWSCCVFALGLSDDRQQEYTRFGELYLCAVHFFVSFFNNLPCNCFDSGSIVSAVRCASNFCATDRSRDKFSKLLCIVYAPRGATMHLSRLPSTFLKAVRLQTRNYPLAVPHYEPHTAVFIFLMGPGYF